MRVRQWGATKMVIIFLFCVTFLTLISCKVNAATWTDPIISATSNIDEDEMYQQAFAVSMTIGVQGMPLRYGASVIKGLHIWLARYTDSQTNISYWAVKSPFEQNFVNLSGVPNDAISLVAGTDTFIWTQYVGNYNYGGLTTTRDAWQVLKLQFNNGKPSYVLGNTKAKQWFAFTNNGNPTQLQVLSYAASPSGRYVIAWLNYEYYLRLDLDTKAIQYVGRFPGAWYDGVYNPYAEAITSDGRYVFISGGPQIVDMSDCHVTLTEQQVIEGINSITTPSCLVTQLGGRIQEKVGYGGYDSYYRWTDNENSLLFFVQPYPYTSGVSGPLTKVTLRLNAPSIPALDYLALGDSYTSGEGDYAIGADDRHDNFLPHTDETGPPTEMCHLSYSSYPMLLREHYNVPSSLMHSVACSGALSIDIDRSANQSLGTIDTYLGQNNRLKNYPDIQSAYQTFALTDFIPGRIEQIKFVEKYQPKVLTIGIGGNDVGFANIINNCVKDANIECSEAQDNGESRQRLARVMRSEFYVLRDLYLKLRSVSPQTKIYVIGYPQFIADSGSPCLLNAGFADADERHFVNESTHYMNMVIKAAAKAAGVQYVNIEGSLNGGELCQGIFTDYVTGVRDQWWIQTILDGSLREYLYHPNAKGHQKIAQAIEKSIGNEFITGQNNAPDLSIGPPGYTDYFGGSDAQSGITTLPTNASGKNVFKQGQQVINTSQAYSYQPDSTTVIKLHSDPISLGEFHVDDQGRLSYQFTVPRDLTPGYHQLVFDGLSSSGEPIEYVQEIFIVGSASNDIDGDGIIDTHDPCLFVHPWGQDNDQDGIDDACDDLIEIASTVNSNEMKSIAIPNSNNKVMTEQGSELGRTANSNNGSANQPAITHKSQSNSKKNTSGWIKQGIVVICVLAVSIIIISVVFYVRKKKYDNKDTNQ